MLYYARLTEKNDIKIFILYLMENVGYPLEFSELNDITVQDGLVNYFDFAQCLGELVEAGNVIKKTESDSELYEITEKGKKICLELQSELRPMIREKSLKNALRLLDFRKKGIKVKYVYSEREDGRYDFSCRITENKNEILKTDLIVDNKKMLDKILYTFDQRPEAMYKGLISLFTGEIDYLL